VSIGKMLAFEDGATANARDPAALRPELVGER
jgi:hypothetical protein